ncbi:MAG: aldehyde reductase [Celeribacter sp.]
MKTVLLTGVTGFIAKRVALEFLEAGYAVRGSLRNPDRAEEVRAALRPHLGDPAALDRLSFVTLDLLNDDGWAEALTGIDALIHTASPFPLSEPKDPDALIRPAREGALRALRAAQTAGVHRVVMTSSAVAIMYPATSHPDSPLTESDWTDPESPMVGAYAKSKTLAERAAWDFVAEHPEMKLSTINPGLVAGEPLDTHYGSSLEVVERVLKGRDPMLPNIAFPVVDVADVAAMHLRAAERDAAIGERFLAAETGTVPMPQMGAWLAEVYPERRIPTRTAPNWLLKVIGLFDPALRQLRGQLGYHPRISSSKASEILGISFTPARQALLKSAQWLIAANKV